jgi:hypothetical protein
MKRFIVAVLSCLMIGSFLTSCATVPPDKQGAYTKKGMPRQAQEQVVTSPGQEEVVPKDGTSQSK